MLQLVIIHYHLDPGGVTSVIRDHLNSLSRVADDCDINSIAVLSSTPASLVTEHFSSSSNSGPRYVEIPALAYDQPGTEETDLAGHLLDALKRLDFAAQHTVIHLHNHSLGKNVSLTPVLWQLAERGYGLLLQMHDFAEDHRPELYRRLISRLGTHGDTGSLYPQGPRIHYAILNSRDASILREAGVDSRRLHYLPNPAPRPRGLPNRESSRADLESVLGRRLARRFLVYPTRGIRRKNLGEALLWSILGAGDVEVAMTLPPQNPAEARRYQHWKDVCDSHDLNCIFGIGTIRELEFEQVLASADDILTTSMAEGYGMVFVEPWIRNRSVLGRDLPDVTADLVNLDLRLEELYEKIAVPIDWIGLNRWRSLMQHTYQHTLASYGGAGTVTDLSPRWDDLLQDDCVDFGRLTVTLQSEVLSSISQDHSRRDRLLRLNPAIEAALANRRDAQARIDHNASVVRDQLSPESVGKRLLDTYRRVLAGDAGGEVAPLAQSHRILEAFLQAANFVPLRVEQ